MRGPHCCWLVVLGGRWVGAGGLCMDAMTLLRGAMNSSRSGGGISGIQGPCLENPDALQVLPEAAPKRHPAAAQVLKNIISSCTDIDTT